MPTDLLGEIHSSTATTSPDWATYRSEVTGMYLLSGQGGGEWDSQHLIREYNRKINSLSPSWTGTIEANATGLFVEPYNAGFSYQGTGDFTDYKWDTYSLNFDGVDEYVDLGTHAALVPEDISISAWVKPDTLSNWEYVVARGLGGWKEAYRFQVGATDLFCAFGNGTSNDSISKAHGMSNSNWYHIAMTYDGATAKLYVDGSSIGSKSISIVMKTAGADTVIGRPVNVGGNYFDGKIDEVAIFNSALSASTISDIYNGGTPQSLASYSPVAWWRMGDGDTFPTLEDSSTNNFTGTMQNMEAADIVADTP
jgi:hypothetical protein